MRQAFEYFDKVFLINLDKRIDRLDRCKEIFKNNNVLDLVERFSAIVPDPNDYIPFTKETEKIKIPLYGCLLSHINIIKKAKSEGLKSILVLEDDVEFINIDYINKAVDQLKNKNWDLFYLGANTHKPLEREDDNLLILKKGYATHAIAYHESFYDFFLENFEKRKIEIIDVWLSDYGQENFKSYCTFPITAVQFSNYSDIHNAFADYSWMENKFKVNTNHLTL
jgi:GR25 family glycosyltransferase involved in LPS biosynthesis